MKQLLTHNVLVILGDNSAVESREYYDMLCPMARKTMGYRINQHLAAKYGNWVKTITIELRRDGDE